MAKAKAPVKRTQMGYADCDPKAAKCSTTFNGLKLAPFMPNKRFSLKKAALGYVLAEGQTQPDENTNYTPVIMTDFKIGATDEEAVIWVKSRYYFGFTEVVVDGTVKGQVELTGTFDKAFMAYIEAHADEAIETVVLNFLTELVKNGKTHLKVGSFVRVNIEKTNYQTGKTYVKRSHYIPMFDFAD